MHLFLYCTLCFFHVINIYVVTRYMYHLRRRDFALSAIFFFFRKSVLMAVR